jgi:hypothetical protein
VFVGRERRASPGTAAHAHEHGTAGGTPG